MDFIIPMAVCSVVALVFFFIGRSFGRDDSSLMQREIVECAAQQGAAAGFVAGVIAKTVRDRQERDQ